MDSTIVTNILASGIRPLMALNVALAFATALYAVLVPHNKRWIPIVCGIVAVLLIIVQIYMPYSKLYTTIGQMGMGRPEVVGQATRSLLSASFIAPFITLLAFFGMAFSFFSKAPTRVIATVIAWFLFMGANYMLVQRFDRDLSTSLADSRYEKEDQLIEITRQAFLRTLEDAENPLKEDEAREIEVYPPRSIHSEIYRDDFFKIHPPPSMLSALLTGRLEEVSQQYSATLESIVVDAHREACAEEGRRLALKRLKQPPEEENMK